MAAAKHSHAPVEDAENPAPRYEPSREELHDLNEIATGDELRRLGGVEGLLAGMCTNRLAGLAETEVEAHRAFYGPNKLEPRPPKGFFQLLLEALNDTTLIILLVSAVVSIILGVIDIGGDEELGWLDGVAILVAVIIVVLVTACNDYSKERQFRKLNAVKEDKKVKVVRGGKQLTISIHDVVVGDVLLLELGDQIAADGILLEANDMKCDESPMTGEAEEIRKDTRDRCFVVGSCLVTHGSGRMLVTAVGATSKHGEIMAKLTEEDEETPLQEKLDDIAKLIGYAGMAAAGLTFLALVVKFFIAGKQSDPANFAEWVSYFILAITILVMAVPEGLPLAVTISLAYSMKKMIKDQCLVRKLQACETMGSVSNITSDKTGTLTKNQMTVVRMRVGDSLYSTKVAAGSSSAQELPMPSASDLGGLSAQVVDLFNCVSCINSTAMLEEQKVQKIGKNKDRAGDSPAETKTVVVGNKTEGALLLLSKRMGASYLDFRNALVIGDNARGAVAHMFEFTSDRKSMSVVLDSDKFAPNASALLNAQSSFPSSGYTVLVKGASEIILGKCKRILTPEGELRELTPELRRSFDDTILDYARGSLRTLCLAYKQMSRSEGEAMVQADEASVEQVPTYASAARAEADLTLICLVGIQDPLRDGVADAVRRCTKAGIKVRMVTGDNLVTAVAIAKECNILPSDISDEDLPKHAISGPDFRKLGEEEATKLLSTLNVMARSAPTDKYRMVRLLQAQSYVVAATGDGSNDAPQLKAADVGLAMGVAGTEVAKEASDIIIMDDNFVSIVRAVEWGRTVVSNVRKFIQFQLSVNVVACLMAFLGAAVLGESPLTSIQILYVNLIMDSMGSLALATEGPTADVLDADPVPRMASMITPGMLRNIVAVSVYQSLVILLLMFPGLGDTLTMVPQDLLDITGEKADELRTRYRYTCIYNFFIFAQIFNEFNSRRIGSELNVFKGIIKNPMFMAIIAITTVVQIIIMLVPGIRFVFNIFDCEGENCPYDGVDENGEPIISYYELYGITWQSWLVTLALAAFLLIYHLLFRLIKVPREFKVSEKRVQAWIAKKKKKDAKKAADKAKEEARKAEKEAKAEAKAKAKAQATKAKTTSKPATRPPEEQGLVGTFRE